VESKLTITERAAGDVTILTLAGQMLLDDGDLAFGRHVSALATQGKVRIVADLADVTYIDSSGVGMLAAKLKHVRQRGGDIRLLRLSGRSQRLLGMLKLMTVFEVYEDEESALRSFEARPGGP
jgi:anti-anti-sigma factor